MNAQRRIERCLKAAPRPTVPDGLLDKLQKDLAFAEAETQRSVLQRWFAPTGGRISLRRVAAVILIGVVVLLPLTYGAGKIVKVFVFSIESRQIHEDGGVTVIETDVKLSGDFADEEDARRVWEETRQLKKGGRYERTFRKEIERNGVKHNIYTYRYTLSNGRVVQFNESEDVDDQADR